jgi:sialate O-acetylesterase
MFTVTKNAQGTPQEDCTGKWEVCAPETVGHFSAVGYFFARHLEQNLQVPIGIIHTSWGGTPAEHWTPTDVLAADPDYAGRFKSWEATKANYPKAKAAYDEAMAKWKTESEAAKAAGKPVPPAPRAPQGNTDFGSPGCLYNGMIAPLLPYTIRGAIWYQGEANAGNFVGYQKLFPLMIQTWRERWGIGEFPFLFVQLANFRQRFDQPTDSQWAGLREAQLRTLDVPHTGMAVAIDIGDANDIHPKNKQEVGRRLALNALATVYFKDIDYSGPLPSGAQGEEGKVRITFRYAEGLKTTDGGKPKGFAIAGEDKKFHWAEAEIQGDHVLLQSPDVPKPIAARYGWADNPEVNLINGAGLPASPFRTDDWPQTQFTPAAAGAK